MSSMSTKETLEVVVHYHTVVWVLSCSLLEGDRLEHEDEQTHSDVEHINFFSVI